MNELKFQDREIVILANSCREKKRCIAGIDMETGEWIRPVSYPDADAISTNFTKIMIVFLPSVLLALGDLKIVLNHLNVIKLLQG